MKENFNWAVAGTGWIASDMAEILKKHDRTFYGVTSGHRKSALRYAEKYHVRNIFDSVEELCADPEIDILYIATPHNTHYEIARKALLAGKHCLVEKSITLNSRELEELTALADEKQLCIAEAMTTWHMPVIRELKKLTDSGELGKVQMISVNFGSMKPYDMENRFFNLQYAGGALLDIGVYALSAVRLFLSGKPSEISGQCRLCAAGSDEAETILLKNADGQLASVTVSLHSKQPKRAMISCEKGYMEIMEYPRAGKAEIVSAETGERRVMECGDPTEALFYEVLDFEETIRENARFLLEAPENIPDINTRMSRMCLACTRDNMEIMTRLRKEWNLKYPGEEW